MTAVTERTVEMYPLKSRILEVVNVRRITPRMVRIDLGGSDIAGMRSDNFADHVKLWFPNPDTGEHVLPIVEDNRCLNFRDPGVIYRDYTVRRFDAEAGLLTIDFVIHDNGPGGRWAAKARPATASGCSGRAAPSTIPRPTTTCCSPTKPRCLLQPLYRGAAA